MTRPLYHDQEKVHFQVQTAPRPQDRLDAPEWVIVSDNITSLHEARDIRNSIRHAAAVRGRTEGFILYRIIRIRTTRIEEVVEER